MAPVLLRPASLMASAFPAAVPSASRDPAFIDFRYKPAYPIPTPLEDVLRRVRPGSDEFTLERDAYEIGVALNGWAQLLRAGTLDGIRQSLTPDIQSSVLVTTDEVRLREGGAVETFWGHFPQELHKGAERPLRDLAQWLKGGSSILSAEFEITGITAAELPDTGVELQVRYSVVAAGVSQREQRVGLWRMSWLPQRSSSAITLWRASRWQAKGEQRSVIHGPGFVDMTHESLGAVPSYREQMLRGSDEWRTLLDGASGIDVYGNNGVAAGDFDNDGFDDLYVCQPAGLPNRLYRNRGDGTFDDVTEKAGVGVLDNTACALFADFRNIGLQDLLVVCGTGPILFLNAGDGTFREKKDAFQFARPAQGSFTHAAIADYDRDGRLDIYFCLYSYYLGLDQYHYPTPYFDARNGPPNFLFQNQGDGTFVDRTEAAGLNADNDRYSFACAWGEAGTDGAPDLYVVNDFGRNNLYRNNGNGAFHSAATAAHVEDVGAGMSAAWGDYNNDGRPDLYVADMWSAAGQRISEQPAFQQRATDAVRTLYQQHAHGNALYRNLGEGAFQNETQRSGTEVGRWAWCSDFLDFDHDGFSDLYVTNGYITALESDPRQRALGESEENTRGIDLGSFFWRQVVAKSPNDATPSLAYEHGWNALNELIRTDSSWSGNERNVMLANNRDGTFSEIAGAIGLDCLEDGRSFALVDLDHDGRLEIVLKNRNAPQLRILRNALEHIGDSMCFRLRGTKSNRDAIGTSVVVSSGDLRQTRSLQAGSGFLAQHSKELFFGLGTGLDSVHAVIRWPSGLSQEFHNLPRNSRIHLEEGEATFKAEAFHPYSRESAASGNSRLGPDMPSTIETWLLDPLKAPAFTLPDTMGKPYTLRSFEGLPVLLVFWSAKSTVCLEQLRQLGRHQASSFAAQCRVVAINLDLENAAREARSFADREKFAFPVVFATPEIGGVYNLIFRYLFDRRRDLALTTAFLVNSEGQIVKVYQGSLTADRLAADARSIPTTTSERMRKALPFPGKLYRAAFDRNQFTYGVAMFNHGYLDQAAEFFQQVIAATPDNAEGYYNLGTLNLRRNRFDDARRYLQQTLKLKPDYPEAWNNLGMIAAQQGQNDEAIRSFQQSLELRPGYATALLNLGNVYRRQHAFPQAQDYLKQALRLQPDDPEANYSLGMLYAQQGQLQPAADALQRAVALRPDYAEALNNLGVLAVRQQDYAKAEQQFRTCIRLVPGFEEAYLNLARLYVLQHDKTKAREVLQALLQLRPESTIARQGLQMLDAVP